MDLILENLRTFMGVHTFPVAPLTLITGENSSGKSTLLAGLACVCDFEGFPFRPAFNRPPYSLGSFDTIVSHRGKRPLGSFAIGYTRPLPRPGAAERVLARYTDVEGQPALAHLVVSSGPESVTIEVKESSSKTFTGNLRVVLEDRELERQFSFSKIPGEGRGLDLSTLVVNVLIRGSTGESVKIDTELFQRLHRISSSFAPASAVSVAPIRFTPNRVYSQASDLFDPTGNHIPMVLDRMLRSPTAKETRAVIDSLNRFGAASGMFTSVTVRRLGRKVGAPFQVEATVGGRPRNLLDVGYGVSQSLPIVVQLALLRSRDMLLLQQPEVHLHPRAQAALGTLFAEAVAKGKRRLVIETHSDYIIDRVRQEVAAGSIPPESVRILFLERRRAKSRVWPVALDGKGNLLKAPVTYGAFFLEEQMRLFDR